MLTNLLNIVHVIADITNGWKQIMSVTELEEVAKKLCLR